MPFTKDRYVAVCQQFLATAVVTSVAFTAAGVMTLEIVAPDPAGSGAPGQVRADDLAPAIETTPQTPTQVATKPVAPRVREVAVATAPEATRREAARDAKATEGVTQGKRLAVLSKPAKVTGYATVGVTWHQGERVPDEDIDVQVRTRTAGKWSGWSTADYHDDHGPDAGSAEAAAVRPGTDALVVGDVDEVQMRAETTDGSAPDDVKLAVIDPGQGAEKLQAPAIDTSKLDAAKTNGDAAGAPSAGTTSKASMPSSAGDLSLSAMAVPAKPYIYSRAQWGANESLRNKSSLHYGTVKAGFVHHTVNANNYTAAQVPSLIRGIYAYHTKSRGWSDLGYNFLVDRFGRIWEGRYGGVDRNPVGAHTLGYNEVSFAMSAIGNFDVAKPPVAVVDAYARLFAWKLAKAGINASSRKVYVKNRYFSAINGHRDAGSTACPGRYLYSELGAIRTKARAIQTKAGTTTTPKPPPPPAEYDPTQTPTGRTGLPSSITFPTAFTLAGDAKPDLVLGDSAGRIRTLPFNKPTAMGSLVTSQRSLTSTPTRTLVGDMTRDGRADLLVRNANGAAWIHAGLSTGRFSDTRLPITRAQRHLSMVAGAGDLNGDRLPDLVARHSSTKKLYLVPGRGNGALGQPVPLAASWSAQARQLFTVGDLTGDRRTDLVMLTTSGQLKLIPGTGRGFGTPVVLPTVSGSAFVGAGDLDADGFVDLVFVRSGQMRALRGSGNGRFASTPWGPVGLSTAIRPLGMGQVTGSAHADLVGLDSAARPVVSAHNGQRTFGAPVTSAALQKMTAVMNVGDWNRDGKNDIVVRSNGGATLTLRRGLGNGAFDKGVSMGSKWGRITQLTAVGDVNGDRRPDLVGRIGSNGMRIFPGNGVSGFGKPMWAPRSMKTFGALGNSTWRTYEVPRSIYASAGGTFVPITGESAPIVQRSRVASAGYDVVLGTGDWNGDGAEDVVARERSTGNLWLLPARGAITGETRQFLGSGFGGYTALG